MTQYGSLHTAAEVVAKHCNYLILFTLRFGRQVAQLGKSLGRDMEGKALEGLIAAELRLDNRGALDLMNIEHTLRLAL